LHVLYAGAHIHPLRITAAQLEKLKSNDDVNVNRIARLKQAMTFLAILALIRSNILISRICVFRMMVN